MRGDGTAELGPVNQLNVRARRTDGLPFNVTFRASMYTLTGVSAGSIAHAFASQINATNWTAAGALIPLQAQSSGATLTDHGRPAGH